MIVQPSLWGTPDPETVERVTVVDKDWRRERDRDRIDQAIQRVAARHGGLVDPNHIRAELTNEHGLTVNPRALSARYMALTHAGVLVWEPDDPRAWSINDDVRGGNAGKWQKVRRWVGAA